VEGHRPANLATDTSFLFPISILLSVYPWTAPLPRERRQSGWPIELFAAEFGDPGCDTRHRM